MFGPIETVWRRRNLVLAVTLMSMMVSYSFGSLRKNEYGASVFFQVRRDYPQFAARFWQTDLCSFLKKVEEDMTLQADPNFNFELPADMSVLERIRSRNLKVVEGFLEREKVSTEDRILVELQNSVHVLEHQPRQAIEIRVLSRSPSLSAEIANQLGKMYQSVLGQEYEFLTEEQAGSLEKKESQRCRDNFLSFSNARKFDECLKKTGVSSESERNWVLTKKAEENWQILRPPLSPVLFGGGLVGVLLGFLSAFLADFLYYRTQRP